MAKRVEKEEGAEKPLPCGGAGEKAGAAMPDSGRRRLARLLAALALLLAAAAVCFAGYAAWVGAQAREAADEQAQAAPPPVIADDAAEEEEAELPGNPVDFAALREEAPDACAWLYVPGTNVNLAVVQSPTDDSFYLDHAIDGGYSVMGSAFVELKNAADFTDDVTLVYGHNAPEGAMFSTLHSFQDEAFFAEHDEFCVYTPGHVLTYRIVSAYLYDNRHILNSFDLSDPDVLRGYLDFVAAPDSMSANVREGAYVEDGSRIVQLSTCPDGTLSASARYLVTGVLVDDQPTK